MIMYKCLKIKFKLFQVGNIKNAAVPAPELSEIVAEATSAE
jgi:hypothetical protein